MGSRSHRFSLADVVVVMVVGLVLLGLFGSAITRRSAEQGYRIKCASNLRQIGLAIQMYCNDNKGEFPRTLFSGPEDPNPVPTAFTGSNVPKAFSQAGPANNDVTAALFLAMTTQDLTSEVFVCPSDLRADRLQGDIQQMSNWPGRQNLSYSYQNSYPSQAAVKVGFKLNFTLSSDFAIAADMNPGGPQMTSLTQTSARQQMKLGNSNNHNADGQNVLYADGHCEFQTTPFCGMPRPKDPSPNRDNIYTAGGPNARDPVGPTPVILSAAMDERDSILLPVAPEGPSPMSGERSLFRGQQGVLIGVGVFALIGIGLLIFAMVRKSSSGRGGAMPPPLPPGA
jgi:prepilin-type processing-associated H-X9-DG protein